MLPFAVNRTTLAMLQARMCTLEMWMAVIARILDVRHDRPALTDPRDSGPVDFGETTYMPSRAGRHLPRKSGQTSSSGSGSKSLNSLSG